MSFMLLLTPQLRRRFTVPRLLTDLTSDSKLPSLLRVADTTLRPGPAGEQNDRLRATERTGPSADGGGEDAIPGTGVSDLRGYDGRWGS